MRFFGIKKSNYKKNKELSALIKTGEMICGQALGAVGKMRYGICPMSFNGCEVIAVYNALAYLGRPQPLCEVAAYMERFRMLCGFFGCNARYLGKALGHFGAECTRTKSYEGAEAFIITFWTGFPFFSSLHTVFCVRTRKGIKVYNSYNTCPDVRIYSTLSDYTGRHRPVAVYIIREQNNGI